MEVFFRAAALAVVCTVLTVTVRKETKELGLLLSLAGCVLLVGLTWKFLTPILEFLRRLTRLSNLSGDMVGILLKITGVSLLGEAACSVCEDAGESTLGRITKVCAGTTVLYLSLPLFQGVLDLVEGLLGG